MARQLVKPICVQMIAKVSVTGKIVVPSVAHIGRGTSAQRRKIFDARCLRLTQTRDLADSVVRVAEPCLVQRARKVRYRRGGFLLGGVSLWIS